MKATPVLTALILRDTHAFLKPFYCATLELEGDLVTLDHAQKTMDFLVWHFKRSMTKHVGKTTMISSITTAWFLFDKYYKLTDDTPYYVAAVLLHPSRRKQYLNTQWEKKWINPGVNRAKQLWKSQYRDCKSREATPLPRVVTKQDKTSRG
ncbi:hypothetical protein LTR16_011605, partial [Cryomyces antarcticus]